MDNAKTEIMEHVRAELSADLSAQVAWVTMNVTGYQASEDVELVEDGELLRRGEVRIRLERVQDG